VENRSHHIRSTLVTCNFSSRLAVTFVGYESELRALDIWLPDKEIDRLEKYGFTRFSGNYIGDLIAGWSAQITGHGRDHNSLSAYFGVDLLLLQHVFLGNSGHSGEDRA
jgi:hypothetical protein